MSLRQPLIKETTRLIREARRRWDAHENASCRRMREEALKSYNTLTKDEKAQIPETHRVWLRYRSERYFGSSRTKPGTKNPKPVSKSMKEAKRSHAPQHSTACLWMDSPVGRLVMLTSKKGISGVYFGHRIEKSTLPPESSKNLILKKAARQLEEFFAKKRESFDLPLEAKGSAFQRSIWRELSKIPFGQTRSYGDLADAIGNPKAVRAVGLANGANPISIIVPCHRVIGKNGALVGFGGGLEIKTKLLKHEGFLL